MQGKDVGFKRRQLLTQQHNARSPEHRRKEWRGNFRSVEHLGAALTAAILAIRAIIVASAARSSLNIALASPLSTLASCMS